MDKPDPIDRPILEVHSGDLPSTVRALAKILTASGRIFDRGGVLVDLAGSGTAAVRTMPLTQGAVRMLAHEYCRPVRRTPKGDLEPVTLSKDAAELYLSLRDPRVLPLAGISTAPLLRDDGSIVSTLGYDEKSQIFVDQVPKLTVPDEPTKAQAKDALKLLRKAFATFPFEDAVKIERDGVEYVDQAKPAGLHESTYLAAVLTAVCRPSLWLAPGILITSPKHNGAGSGKGKLVRAASLIAFGIPPKAGTKGHNDDELDKRVVSGLLTGEPSLLFDNINSTALTSDTLASALTERPSWVRLLGTPRNATINSAAVIWLTGNDLKVSADMARRVLQFRIDPQMEDPESRSFAGDFLADIAARRGELLNACLTIWRWGRINSSGLTKGLALGSFETWAAWVRDPLLTLGCRDPVEGVRLAKQADPARQDMAELFDKWWEHHKGDPVKLAKLHPEVIDLLDPHRRGRQYQAVKLASLVGVRQSGMVMEADKGIGKWSAICYFLTKVQSTTYDPDAPMTPYAKESTKNTYTGGREPSGHRGHRGLGPRAERRPPPDYDDPVFRRARATELAWRAAWVPGNDD